MEKTHSGVIIDRWFHTELEVDKRLYQERDFEFIRQTIMQDIKDAGMLPIVGTESESIVDVTPDVVRVELKMAGHDNPHGIENVEYITDDGYVQWSSTKSRSDRS